MAIRIISPQFSFVNLTESPEIETCGWPNLFEVLPIVEDSDVWFQFILETDTKAEADALCADTGTIVKLGLTNNCLSNNSINFTDLPERGRLDDTHVLYNWVHGFPLFTTVYDVNDCFNVRVTLNDGADSIEFCSATTWKRQSTTCYTAVLDYGNDDNFAGFDYCGGVLIDSNVVDCTPMEVAFINQNTVDIPYTAQLLAKYGTVPSVKVWLYNTDGSLYDPGLVVTLDAFPPTNIHVDLGGTASGIVKIS